ncbi:unnamed protein product, partial [Ectocarpus sp. 8 AP-2014]
RALRAGRRGSGLARQVRGGVCPGRSGLPRRLVAPRERRLFASPPGSLAHDTLAPEAGSRRPSARLRRDHGRRLDRSLGSRQERRLQRRRRHARAARQEPQQRRRQPALRR